MAGATILLTPACTRWPIWPDDLLHRTGNEIGYPIVRDMDTFMYERQSHETMEVGSCAHRPILVRPDARLGLQMHTDGARRLNRSSPSCLNSGAQRTDFFHGLLIHIITA